MKWFHRWQVLNLRVFLIALVFLLIFDLAIRWGEGVWFASEVRRLPADDPSTMARWKNQVQEAKGFTVLFIGDSVVHGGGVAEERDTLPALFARELSRHAINQPITVINCSLPGNTPSDAWVLSRYLADTRPDLVIYDANLGWFGNRRIVEHPGLVNLPGVDLSQDDQKRLQVQPQAITGGEAKIASITVRGWALYRDRVFLNYWWWGQPYREKIKSAMQNHSMYLLLPHAKSSQQQEQLSPWYEKDTASLKTSRGILGSQVLAASNPQWYYYQRLIAAWQDHGSQVVVFTVPRNQTLLDNYQVINQQQFYRKQNMLLTTAQREGAKVFDYTYGVVDDRQFTDTVHPTSQGNRQLAHRLYNDIEATGLLASLSAKER